MSARASGVIVAGGRHYALTLEDLAFLERTMLALGAKEIHPDGTEGVAAQVEAWARERGIRVWRVTANWMHDGPATRTERNPTLAGLARTVIAFPGDGATEDLLAKARQRRLSIVENRYDEGSHRKAATDQRRLQLRFDLRPVRAAQPGRPC